ncbi:MAG: hypothetical protein R6U41_07805, partial [Desulfosalsimonas sp.]|uniref:hypothetical protein n=1 Tax=Desulfosalsimonas sp. TaxID=3073848 RepID=UPI0039709F28
MSGSVRILLFWEASRSGKEPVYDTGDDAEELSRDLEQYDAVIASMHGTHEIPSQRYGLKPEYLQLLRQISQLNNIVLVHFGNPYGLNYYEGLDEFWAVLTAYNDKPITQEITAQTIFGANEISGALPVSVNDRFKVNKLITLSRNFAVDNNKLKKELDFTSEYNFKEGLEDCYNYYN